MFSGKNLSYPLPLLRLLIDILVYHPCLAKFKHFEKQAVTQLFLNVISDSVCVHIPKCKNKLVNFQFQKKQRDRVVAVVDS